MVDSIIASLIAIVPVYFLIKVAVPVDAPESRWPMIKTLSMVLMFAIYAAYHVAMETSSVQATLGKKMLGMRVTGLDDDTITVGQSLVRLVLKTLISPIFLIGFFVALFTQRNQSLHDLVASTVVVTT